MGQVQISGTLQGGPPTGGNVFPAAQFITPLTLSSSPKSFQSASGILTKLLSDTGTFVELSAIGTGKDVPRANTVYIRADGDFQLRITQDDGTLNPGTPVVIVCKGLFVMEVPDNRAILLLEVAASCKLEYFASGP